MIYLLKVIFLITQFVNLDKLNNESELIFTAPFRVGVTVKINLRI